jgi:Family of unknown function (DUF6326)
MPTSPFALSLVGDCRTHTLDMLQLDRHTAVRVGGCAANRDLGVRQLATSAFIRTLQDRVKPSGSGLRSFCRNRQTLSCVEKFAVVATFMWRPRGFEMIERIAEASSRLTAGVEKTTGMKDRKVTLSTLWIFAVLNYIYADVFTAMDPLTDNGSVHMTHGLMLGAAVLMETAIVMIPLSRILKYRVNRWANIVAGAIHTAAVILSLFVGRTVPPSYYVFFASVEIVSTSVIVCYAWKWPNLEVG